MRDPALPERVQAKGRWYYYVAAEGKKRIWHKLSCIRDGLPALYTALAEHLRKDAQQGMMPSVISEWERECMGAHTVNTQKTERARNAIIARRFAEFHARDVEPADVLTFLTAFESKPRTWNAYRAHMGELMRFAMLKGYRPLGTNPVQGIIKTKRIKARTRYITDSELRRIKVFAMRAKDRHGHDLDTRSGPMLCALVDMAYLTGQAIGDLLDLRWKKDPDDEKAPHFKRDGVWFARKKVDETTGEDVLVRWTPKLRDVERRLKELRIARQGVGKLKGRQVNDEDAAQRVVSDHVFLTQDGTPYTYWGASSAWRRAVKRAGVKGVTFHDLRAKALTDKERREGMQAARVMGSHSTEAQTADYIRSRTTREVDATR